MSASIYIFFLPSCPYCNKIKPHLERVWTEFKDKAKFYMVDASDTKLKGYVEKYKVKEAPSFVVDRPGMEPVTIQTANADVLIEKIKALL